LSFGLLSKLLFVVRVVVVVAAAGLGRPACSAQWKKRLAQPEFDTVAAECCLASSREQQDEALELAAAVAATTFAVVVVVELWVVAIFVAAAAAAGVDGVDDWMSLGECLKWQ
jgi:hypothetical protein